MPINPTLRALAGAPYSREVFPDRPPVLRRKPGKRITPEMIEFIKANTLKMVRPTIAEHLGVSCRSIQRVQDNLGLPRFTRQTGRLFSKAQREGI